MSPIYDYRCLNCGREFTDRQNMPPTKETIHDDCGGIAKLIPSLPAVPSSCMTTDEEPQAVTTNKE